MTREQVLASIREHVAFARERCDDVEFSAEDAIRTERDFLVEALAAAVEAGATTLNVPDTVGYGTPDEIEDLFRYLIANVSGQGPDLLRALPRRSGHGGRQLPRRGARRRAAGRMHDQRHRRTRGQCAARGCGDGAAHPQRCVRRNAPVSTRRRSCTRATPWRRSPTARRRATRRSSAPTPSPTNRASTSTAC